MFGAKINTATPEQQNTIPTVKHGGGGITPGLERFWKKKNTLKCANAIDSYPKRWVL